MNFILDSGAFSAANSGKPLSLDSYISYIQANRDWLTHYISLDVITQYPPDLGASMSDANYQQMIKAGLSPIPVYHFGEDIRWLEKMLDSGADYIALGGTAILSSKKKSYDWYAAAWARLVNRDGLPIVKVHAFGETDEAILNRFPWQSADSATWIQVLRSKSLIVNGNRRAASSFSARDIEIILARFTRALPEEFHSVGKIGRTLQTYLTAMHYVDLQKRIRALPIRRYFPTGFLSCMPSYRPSARPAIQLDPFNLYLSITAFPQGMAALNTLNHNNLLASFFYLNPDWRDIVIGGDEFIRTSKQYKEYHAILNEYLHAAT